ncbi:hypothetical protein L7F22_023778 [Adiantum nelumboides]|nr:hypothetical protein [Adiantum nelumboides]
MLRQNQSPWLFMDAANVIFSEAKARVFIGDVKKNVSSALPAARNVPSNDGIDQDEEEAAFGPGVRNGQASSMVDQRPWWLPPGIEPTLEECLNGICCVRTNVLPDSRLSLIDELVRLGREHHKRGQTREEGDGEPAKGLLLLEDRSWQHDQQPAQQLASNATASGSAQGSAGARGNHQQSTFESEQLKRKDMSNKRRRTRGGHTVAGMGRKNTESAPENLEAEAGDVASFMKNAIQHSLDDFGPRKRKLCRTQRTISRRTSLIASLGS